MVDRANKPSALASTPTSLPQPTVDISSDKGTVTATLPTGENVTVLLHGATVISWKSHGGQTENLWLSDAAILDGSKPVRGGIPVVFPVFGAPPSNHATSNLAQHGFARNSRWEYLGKSTSESDILSKRGDEGVPGDDCVKLDFGLYSATLSEEARKAWPYDFGLVYSVTLGPNGLQTMVNVRNEGSEGFDFQTLLHTYLRVEDIGTTTVTGLLGAPYVDRTQNGAQNTQSDATLHINGEVDRVYKSLTQDTTSVLVNGKPRFDVVRDNVSDTVVWNPAREKAAAMGDFQPKDGWQHMLCVEAGAVAEWQRLEGGETWEGGQILRSLL